MKKKDLRARWTPDLQSAANKAVREASGKMNLGSMPMSPFGFTDNHKADFRGLDVYESIRYMRVEDIDMSYAVFKEGASLSQSEFLRCVFDGIDMRGTIVTRRFEATSFIGAKLTGMRPGTDYVDCDFTGAAMGKSVAMGSKFKRCNFSEANMAGAIYSHCIFDECQFDGAKLDGVSFAGSQIFGAVDVAIFSGCLTDKMKINGEDVVGVDFNPDKYLRV
ncbi:pentapeptide repeat-containing protein [Xanthomonas sp. AmX2]|uniref:pentapeptide repeat-containing protein n=1 Tax=Xanthomonas sp. TaxID=29446 RepID=UPI00197E2877|nr:pentapeptide repeat-containing protein [Xanthomonas sp.]MBN6150904.1 pentapeptide repeat-containing protein [Xanthomonas sp.]